MSDLSERLDALIVAWPPANARLQPYGIKLLATDCKAEIERLRADLASDCVAEPRRLREKLAEQQAEIVKLRAERAEARSFIRSTYDQFEKHHPYAHELRTRYPWLEDAVANAELLQLAEQHPAPQEWYDEAAKAAGGGEP